MYKVKVYATEEDDLLFTSLMPSIPRIGDCIGFWKYQQNKSEWVVAKVTALVYEFDESNQFECVEITIWD